MGVRQRNEDRSNGESRGVTESRGWTVAKRMGGRVGGQGLFTRQEHVWLVLGRRRLG